jgi:predicted Zn-dependent protease
MDDVEAGSDPQYRAPTQALIEIERGRPDPAIELLASVRPYELGLSCIPTYVRGLAHMRAGRPREAAAELGVITAHRGSLANALIYPLAWLQLARARAATSDMAGARQAYGRFLTFWKDADPDVPVFLAARAELAALGR